jgi:hypothetical protein
MSSTSLVGQHAGRSRSRADAVNGHLSLKAVRGLDRADLAGSGSELRRRLRRATSGARARKTPSVVELDHHRSDCDEAKRFDDARAHGRAPRSWFARLGTPSNQTGDERDDEQYQEDEEQELRDRGGPDCNAAEAEERRD